MQTRRLGPTDLHITPIGFGAWAIGGGGWAFGWGPQDDADSVAAIHESLNLGINWIDTAAIYGLGHSEEVVSRVLEHLHTRPLVFTKCERVWNEQREIGKCLKAESIRRECEASLKRLRVDVIDLYQIHWPEPIEDIEEGWSAVVQLKEQGKIRWGGVSNFDVPQLQRIQPLGAVASLQPPYSLVNRSIEAEILPYCGRENIGTLVYSPMASGLLTGAMTRERIASLPADDWRRKNRNYQEPLLSRNLRLADELTAIGRDHHCTAGAVAIAWVLRRPEVTAAIAGSRRPGQMPELIAGAELTLSAEECARLERIAGDQPA